MMGMFRSALVLAVMLLTACQKVEPVMIKCEAKRDPQGEGYYGEYIYVRSPDGALNTIKCGQLQPMHVVE